MSSLGLGLVDLVKMNIEGAELAALQGDLERLEHRRGAGDDDGAARLGVEAVDDARLAGRVADEAVRVVTPAVGVFFPAGLNAGPNGFR